jgi:hypothetical protein
LHPLPETVLAATNAVDRAKPANDDIACAYELYGVRLIDRARAGVATARDVIGGVDVALPVHRSNDHHPEDDFVSNIALYLGSEHREVMHHAICHLYYILK